MHSIEPYAVQACPWGWHSSSSAEATSSPPTSHASLPVLRCARCHAEQAVLSRAAAADMGAAFFEGKANLLQVRSKSALTAYSTFLVFPKAFMVLLGLF